MKVLIIGLGSIARKHIKAIFELEPNANLVALRSEKISGNVSGVENIYRWEDVDDDINFIIISNPTNHHFQTIKKASKFGVPLFIEKPPFDSLDGAKELIDHIEKNNIKTYTAFNMRFLPVLQWVKENIRNKRVIEVQLYCGSYLPEWRPGRNYRNIYSSIKEMGGGVHLDLIHELDYAKWIFGEPDNVTSSLQKISDLEINSIDCAHYVFHYKKKIVTILLNYYRREKKRTLEIVMEDDIWNVDLINGTVIDSKGDKKYHSEVTIADTYLFQMDYFLRKINSNEGVMNDLRESTKTLTYCL
jgi:predicted dehydrogenase